MIKISDIHFTRRGGVTMTKGKLDPHQSEQKGASISLKGTFIAVMLLGVFILISWFALYALFLSR
jgi:hypothetical protein